MPQNCGNEFAAPNSLPQNVGKASCAHSCHYFFVWTNLADKIPSRKTAETNFLRQILCRKMSDARKTEKTLRNLFVECLNGHKKGAMRAEHGKLFRACEVGIDVRKNHRSCYPPPYIYANVFCIFCISLNIFQYNLYKISPPLSSKPLRQRRAVRANKNSVSRAKPCVLILFPRFRPPIFRARSTNPLPPNPAKAISCRPGRFPKVRPSGNPRRTLLPKPYR